jgi:hypothetical protein
MIDLSTSSKKKKSCWSCKKAVSFPMSLCDSGKHKIVSSGYIFCLLWIDKARAKDKIYIWVSVWWKTTNKN